MAPDVQPLPRSTEAIGCWGRNNRSEWSVRQRCDVTEEVLAYYLEASIETALMDRPLTGNNSFSNAPAATFPHPGWRTAPAT